MDEGGARPERPALAANASTAQTSRVAADSSRAASATAPKIQQPKPQALPSRAGPSAILVSPRQKGNPILNGVRSVAWEYSDIPADYVLGATTCALFLSLKYHRLHPEYIYNRIRDLKGAYTLRILLTMVDIDNSEESLQELSKTSLVNNVTVMLCWSAQEAGRYLELFKAFEHAAPTSIRAQQSSSYSDKLVEFITVPRSVNKTDALGLVSNFGSIRTAVNAGPEEIGLIAGWGEKKVQRWCSAVREPFRVKKAARRGVSRDNTRATTSKDVYHSVGEELALEDASDARLEARLGIGQALSSGANRRADKRPAEVWESGNNTERAVQEADPRKARKVDSSESANKKTTDEEMSEGVIAALAKLRQQ